MSNYTNDELRAIAARANDWLSDQWSLFGFPGERWAMTPAMALAVVNALPPAIAPVVAAQPTPADTVTVVAPPAQSAPKPAPAAPVTPPPSKAALAGKAAHARLEMIIPHVITWLQANAVDGIMPNVTEYNAQRGDLPAASSLRGHGYAWSQLAEMAGLRHIAAYERAGAAKRAAGLAPAEPLDDAALEAATIAALREMATDGQMPSQRVWDSSAAKRGLGTAGSIRMRLGVTWTQLGERAGLRPNSMRNLPKPAAQPPAHPKAEAGAAVESAAPFRRSVVYATDAAAPRLSDAARAALGPEHVVVTPHRNGASYR